MVDLNQVEISTSNTWEQRGLKGDAELRIDIEAMIQEAKGDFLSQTCLDWPETCIYKVPRSTREKTEKIYTPTTISIGPFHNGDPRLRDMERYKGIMLKRFIERFRTSFSLDNLISFVRCLEPKVRASYSEDAALTEKEFQKLMLLDGAFIIELFLSVCHLSEDNTQNIDVRLRQPRLLSDVTKDLLLLENQLPFFFLEVLYQKAFLADHVAKPSFLDVSFKVFDSFNSQSLRPDADIEVKHFTDLLRFLHLPKKLPSRKLFEGPKNDVLLYSAKQLAELDIKLNAASMPCSPLDLKFTKDVLEVPTIRVDDNTAILFHNMITLEQCHYPYQCYLSDFALLLDCLINSQEDVNVLITNGIIRNSLGDPSEVVRIFHGLSTDITLRNFNSDYSRICSALNHMARDHLLWRQFWSASKRQFLRSITGFLLNNILTLIQTVIAIRQAK